HFNGGSSGLTFAQSGLFRTLAFIAGCLMSGLTGFIGMSLAVRGNVRTAAAAKSGSLKGDIRTSSSKRATSSSCCSPA
ncbi:MAG TPA: sodium/proton-translocating pyrophosphatase, partial [Acidimicrobiia bacterium]|nr:sodium/proton-translocating pyrophosphatase [Acidimicrobiia bacterium]